MIHSMTGMGRARGKIGASYFLIDIKSVNHKFCEVFSRLPPRFQALEIPLTQKIKKRISRGKIDVSLFEEKSETPPQLNKAGLKNYFRFLQGVRKELKIAEPVSLAHVLAGSSFWMSKETAIEALWPPLNKLIDQALVQLLKMRRTEGSHLLKQILERIKSLEVLSGKVRTRGPAVVASLEEKLKKRVQVLLQEVAVDPGKLANEIAFFADRSDITEEIERLESHFFQAQKLLQSKEPCGRPLDFLIQEMNREWNTIGSKSQDMEISHWVIQAKAELEKMREQVQNIE